MTTSTKRTVGGRLRDIRDRLEMSQGEFAEAVGGCTPEFISMVERGKSGPGASIVAGVERLCFNSHWLLTGEGEPRRTSAPSAPSAPSDSLSVRDSPSSSPQSSILIPLSSGDDVQAGDTILVQIDRRDHPLALIGKIIYTLPRK